MIVLLTMLALLVQQRPSAPPAGAAAEDTIPATPVAESIPWDTLPPMPTLEPDSVFATPATRVLVEQTIRASGEIPAGLEDYRVEVRTGMKLVLAPDSALGGELPITTDELVSDVRWHRPDVLHQWVRAHRTELLVPAPYTLGTLLDQPWVVPHLYGSTIEAISLTEAPSGRRASSRQAVHPFGAQGPLHYRYEAGDTLRLRVRGEPVTLVPVTVRPRGVPGRRDPRLVVGTFWIDVDRGAVARARFGITEPGRGIQLARGGVFLELENGLWQGRYWLPYRQRREVQISSSLLGGAVAGRIVNLFGSYELNTGWEPRVAGRSRLFRAPASDTAAARWDGDVAAELAEFGVGDFADLERLAATDADPGRFRFGLHYERPDHLFRYNRVEGPYLGLGARLEPEQPGAHPWQAYGTAGWAFAEGTARGELTARWQGSSATAGAPAWGLSGGAYRRLRDLRTFDPTFRSDLFYTLPALLGGSDLRDYYGAAGAELGLWAGWGAWNSRIGGRVEQHRALEVNTERFLFGEAEEFPALLPIDPGTHAALEADLAYARGSGAFGIGNSALAALRAEQGVGDFRFGRASGLLSLRRSLGIFTLAGRLDGGHAWGDVPPQKLFRFGAAEGLRGYDDNEFGGSTAAVAHGRFLIGLPPYGAEPIGRSGPLILPPLRPALVLLAEAGWADVSDASFPALTRLGALPTDGVRGSLGAGVSVFNDFVTLEYVRPLDRDRGGRWYFGLVNWF